jgi:hypothetical protein
MVNRGLDRCPGFKHACVCMKMDQNTEMLLELGTGGRRYTRTIRICAESPKAGWESWKVGKFYREVGDLRMRDTLTGLDTHALPESLGCCRHESQR